MKKEALSEGQGVLTGLKPGDILEELSLWVLWESNKFINAGKNVMELTNELVTHGIRCFVMDMTRNLIEAGVMSVNSSEISELHENMKTRGHICRGRDCEAEMAQIIHDLQGES